MSGFERQLAAIKNKAELHEWIDSLEDGATGVLLLQSEDGTIHWYEYGEITVQQTNWIIDCTKSHMLRSLERQ